MGRRASDGCWWPATGWASSLSITRNAGAGWCSAQKSRRCCGTRQLRPARTWKAWDTFLSLKYVPAPETMFSGIHALPPGNLMRLRSERCRSAAVLASLVREQSHRAPREESYAEELAALLRESVRLHLVSDVPFGAFLSGGIDSSTIVALMSQFLNAAGQNVFRRIRWRWRGDERAALREARCPSNTPRTITRSTSTVRTWSELAGKVVWHLDQPIADQATLANYMVAELAGRHVKMVLTGEGGDELFGGYARHAGDKLSPLLQACASGCEERRARVGVAPARSEQTQAGAVCTCVSRLKHPGWSTGSRSSIAT